MIKITKDLIGQIFGHLTVLGIDTSKPVKNSAKTYWLCQCDCIDKTIKSIRQDHLLAGNIISCGCQRKNNCGRKLIDLIGKRFGRLVVLRQVGKTNQGSITWECQCDCGNKTIVSGASLRNGDTKSCGCLKHEVSSKLYVELGKRCKSKLEGQKFGHLTVIKDSGERQDNQVLWLCQCDCKDNSIIKVTTGNLQSGHTQSCGCLGASKNETIIKEQLKQLKLPYISQYIIPGLRDKKPLPFDFFVEGKYIIEFDGIQHFNYYNNKGWNSKENHEVTRRHDLMKNKYCFEHNIPIIRIPYDQDYTIDDLKLETTRFLLTQENEQYYYNRS